jgi:predicted nucleic acid-binding protein
MKIVVDANILLRLTDPTSAMHGIAVNAVIALRTRGDLLYVVPQSIYEFWAVATRPIANNGLGLSSSECLKELGRFKVSFLFLDDNPALYTEWEATVAAFGCHGKVSHDARYVAAMRTHDITHFLTFNVNDFQRYSGITVLNPSTLSTSSDLETMP